VLLAASNGLALQAASLAIKQALPPICSGCLLVLQARPAPALTCRPVLTLTLPYPGDSA